MTADQKKKPAAGFWITVALVAVLAYPLSVGPVAWLNTRSLLPGWLSSAADYFYYPLEWIRGNAPAPIGRAIMWYAQLWWG